MVVRPACVSIALLACVLTACATTSTRTDGAGGSYAVSSSTFGASSGAPQGALPPPQAGLATWYSDSLAGRHTASGAPYDPRAFTAAHRTLPFGTRVRVRRESTGRAVEVTVNDRGPFGSERRIIDLSRAAATELDMLDAGVVRVSVEVLELGDGRRRRRHAR